MNALAKTPSREKRLFQETIKSARLGIAEAQYEVGLMYANGVGVTQSIGQAIHWVQLSAQRGFANAQYLLGTRYETGTGVAQSIQLAMLWFGRAAEQSHTKAMFRLGKLHARGHAGQAVELYRQAAEAGLAEAQHALALGYANGTGVAKDAGWALHWHRAAAEQGFASSQFALGELFSQGVAVALDMEVALRWYRQAAAQYHLPAKVAIERLEQGSAAATRMRGRGRGRSRAAAAGAERRSEESAWIRAAEAGDADARYHLGHMYALGLGVEADQDAAARWYGIAAEQNHARAQLALASVLERTAKAAAVPWYTRAAEQGEAQAQFALGRIYCAGETFAPDFLQGMSWYVKAAEQGHELALVTLGNLFDGEMHHVAVHCFAQAAARGSAQAQYRLGQHYVNGRGIAAHPGQAFRWFEKAALQRHAGAEYEVGLAYLHGVGVEKAPEQAFVWLQRAAQQGHAKAQWNLASMYAAGTAPQGGDPTQALDWCLRAAEQGLVAAQSHLGVLYAQMSKPDLALQWWRKAAAQNDPTACYNLALAHLQGEGFEKDATLAFEALQVAAQAGLVLAQSRLALLYASGQGVAQDPVEAHKWFVLAAAGKDEAARVNLARSQAVCTAAQSAEGARRAQVWAREWGGRHTRQAQTGRDERQ